ncbi:hypothetical protein Tco_1422513, partial [Tanacetum coccineum]
EPPPDEEANLVMPEPKRIPPPIVVAPPSAKTGSKGSGSSDPKARVDLDLLLPDCCFQTHCFWSWHLEGQRILEEVCVLAQASPSLLRRHVAAHGIRMAEDKNSYRVLKF